MLRRDFEAMREGVLASVRANLGARRVVLSHDDLEACYSQAWQGLYTALMEGQEIENPPGWLALTCYRRAIDEHRRRTREAHRNLKSTLVTERSAEPDLADALDDRLRLRHIFEALSQRLSEREQQAVCLCYLQGLTRAQAAACMGISEARMEKVMDGRGPGRTGVSAKVDAILKTIQGGEWCEQQASLMRGFAFGVHDPDGERHRLAQLHIRECPACRAYVLSLRGLAAVLPPLALPWMPGMAGGLGGALGGGAGAGAGGGIGGAAGGGVAGGWLPLGGSLSVKLATGCLIAAGLGGGCVALIKGPGHVRHALHRHDLARSSGGGPGSSTPSVHPILQPVRPARRSSPVHVVSRTASAASAVPPAGAAERELGFEPTPKSHAHAASARPAHSAASEFGPG
jgi:RNA polymerase sigma factor (sigma-70 family)